MIEFLVPVINLIFRSLDILLNFMFLSFLVRFEIFVTQKNRKFFFHRMSNMVKIVKKCLISFV